MCRRTNWSGIVMLAASVTLLVAWGAAVRQALGSCPDNIVDVNNPNCPYSGPVPCEDSSRNTTALCTGTLGRYAQPGKWTSIYQADSAKQTVGDGEALCTKNHGCKWANVSCVLDNAAYSNPLNEPAIKQVGC